MSVDRLIRRGRVAAILAGAVMLTGCEPGSARVTAPNGASAFARFTVVGGAIAMGAQSGGLASESQATNWPALVAASVEAPFRQPLMRTPGCSPPLVAPLLSGRWLSGAVSTTRDSSCAGAATTEQPPGDNLAIAGATAWAAIVVTPKAIAAAPAAHDIADRQRYPLVLGNTQSQVTAMLVKEPTFVAVELGLAEVAPAATLGLVVAAASYADTTSWTFVPAPVFATTFDEVADSVAKVGAKAVLVSAPRITTLPAFRAASAIWAERAALATYGITVAADCATSANVLNVAALVPARALTAIATGTAQALSCADLPGNADFVLTPQDVAALDAAVAEMNAHMRQAADTRGWAFADLDDAFATIAGGAGAYSARAQLTCATPYGAFSSLDGIHPGALGHQLIADAVARAVNAKYGFALPERGVPFDLRAGC